MCGVLEFEIHIKERKNIYTARRRRQTFHNYNINNILKQNGGYLALAY